MAEAKSGGDFISNLGKIYTYYTGGFFAFVVFLGILEQLGVPNKFIGYGFVFLTIAVYALIGVLSRTSEVGEYYVAGRKVPAFYNGMATGADWMSGASFVGMAGTLFLLGYDGLAFVLGWTGGYVLVAVLIAPFLRKFGAFTVPDFFAERYGGNTTRLIAVIVLISCSFTYVVAQIYATGLIASRFLDLDFTIAVYAGLLGILLCSMLGGMKAVTWTQVAQYIVLIVAYLLPIVILSAKKFGIPLPQLTYGQALQEITNLENSLAAKGMAPVIKDAAGAVSFAKPHIKPFTDYDPLNYFALILCLMVGTASLPHILMRYFTTPSVRDARSSVAWSLFFIFLLYFSAPAYAAFSKLEVYSLINKGTALADLPQWIYTYGKIGLVKVCGANAVDAQSVIAACGKIANQGGMLRLQDLSINTDVIVLSTPEIAGMPYVIAGLVAAGGLAAALSTADGLLLAIANALSHDVYYKMINPNAPTKTRLIASRVLLLFVAIFAAYVASTKPADILSMVAWAFSLAAAGIFPALVLGVWWKRANTPGAIIGMLAGFGVCVYYLVGTRYYAVSFYETWSWLSGSAPAAKAKFVELQTAWSSAAAGAAKDAAWVALDKQAQAVANWFGVKNISAALFGMPVGFLGVIVGSLLTRAPSQEIQDMVDATRRPSGDLIMRDKDAALPSH
ncbi:sodium:solute symporter family protein [Pinisolibacter sp.]|uniref:sodium:solute symporter family protein n=1 Tax=Pinisolibacter sp. TaxID=2172024 RepID=UPI002FDE8FC8